MRIRGMLPFCRAFSFLRFHKGGSIQKLLHLVKYSGKPELGTQLGRWFAAETLLSFRDHFDIIVPVPLHQERLKTRGYNQCLVISQGIAEITGHKIMDVLKREHAANTQTVLNRWERFENTSNEFKAIASNAIDLSSLKEKRILLLDDIITTGATMTGAAIPLLHLGASVAVAALALTQDA